MHISVEKPSDHHTQCYNYYHPVLRRGYTFEIKCNSHKFKVYRNKKPTINLTINNVTFQIGASGHSSDSNWSYVVKSKGSEQGCITIGITSSSDALIGKYNARVSYTDNDEDHGFFSFILFYNPWNPRDITYMKDTSRLNEYILNESTKIFMGSARYHYGSDWYLGQFQMPCIEATLILLQKIPSNHLKDPISVARHMSALVNSNDDNGIVMGNWRGGYSDGTNPCAWRSSVEIMRKYANNKYPVKYGQCWVFGAILCTVCRCIGIPNRLITAFDAFHDGDKSLEWELYYDEHLNLLSRSYDSCWNFHVWTEAWLNRYDLGTEYSGWQILDATPQERSDGIFRVGPAPRYAVKEGYVKTKYDVDFVFAEVNADKVHYVRQKDGKFVPFKVEKGKVGSKILTKKIGTGYANDITNDYKYPDGSSMDRVIDSRIMRVTGRGNVVNSTHRNNEGTSARSNTDNDSSPRIQIECSKKINLGESFNTNVNISSRSGVAINGNVSTTILLVSYNGKIAATLLEDKQSINYKKFKKPYEISGKTITKNMKNEITILKVIVSVMTNSGKFSTKTRSVCLLKPKLTLQLSNTRPKCFRSTTVTISITNTLQKKIKHAKLYVESSCLIKRVGEKIDDIGTGCNVERSIKIKPTKTGTFTVCAYLDSELVSGLHAYATITVT